MDTQSVIQVFSNMFNYSPKYLAKAPGRVNLIGEHTDYNDGFVMPFAIDRLTLLAAAPRNDQVLRIYSEDYQAPPVEVPLYQLKKEYPHWTNYIRGAWWAITSQGIDMPGADIAIKSNIPIGAGVSSSAAIAVAGIETALRLIGDTTLNQQDKALLAVKVEQEFIKLPTGVMDQLASACGKRGEAMLIDCQSFQITSVPIPSQISFVVMNTMKSRSLAASSYSERRQQCEQAAGILQIRSLRDATLEDITQHKQNLGDLLFRRALHVVLENKRTLEMVECLDQINLQKAGKLVSESHASLRDNFEVSCHELNIMTSIAQSHPSCYGARMMGGGFGGSAIALVKKSSVVNFCQFVEKEYLRESDLCPEIFVCQPSSGSSTEVL